MSQSRPSTPAKFNTLPNTQHSSKRNMNVRNSEGGGMNKELQKLQSNPGDTNFLPGHPTIPTKECTSDTLDENTLIFNRNHVSYRDREASIDDNPVLVPSSAASPSTQTNQEDNEAPSPNRQLVPLFVMIQAPQASRNALLTNIPSTSSDLLPALAHTIGDKNIPRFRNTLQNGNSVAITNSAAAASNVLSSSKESRLTDGTRTVQSALKRSKTVEGKTTEDENSPPPPAKRRRASTTNKASLYCCNLCNSTYSFLSELNNHTTQVHGKYRCHLCEGTFTHRSNLLRHMLIHAEDKPFQCDICGKPGSRKDHLKRHILQCHQGCIPEEHIRENHCIPELLATLLRKPLEESSSEEKQQLAESDVPGHLPDNSSEIVEKPQANEESELKLDTSRARKRKAFRPVKIEGVTDIVEFIWRAIFDSSPPASPLPTGSN